MELLAKIVDGFQLMMMMMMNCYCGMVDRRKVFTPYFQPGSLSEILTIVNQAGFEPTENLSSDFAE